MRSLIAVLAVLVFSTLSMAQETASVEIQAIVQSPSTPVKGPPALPFFRRTLYSMSRVFLTQADSGHQTFNASKIMGGAASQAIADLYVPGERQGLHPIWGRVTFNLVRDAGLNMVHEFWPDIHREL